MRIVRARQKIAGQNGYRIIEDLMETVFQLVMVMLQWIFHLVPLAVFGVVARTVGTQGFKPLIVDGRVRDRGAAGAGTSGVLLPHAHAFRLVGAAR